MTKPFSYKLLTRILLIIIFILSILAGYYQSSLLAERKKYLRLENNYVRVRSELGIEETQRLIDQSYENEKNLDGPLTNDQQYKTKDINIQEQK